MFGFGLLVPDYYDYIIDIFGGVRAALPITLFTRLVVGIGWFRMLRKAGKPGWHALIPLWGELQVFRIVYDDFAFGAIFAGSTMMAWVGMMGVQHQMVSIFWFVNGLMWWIMCLFTCISFGVSYVFWPIYAIVPWAGALFFGKLDHQNGVFTCQAEQHDQPQLGVNTQRVSPKHQPDKSAQRRNGG